MSSGLVSSTVEQEVLGDLRRRGIVVWLDSAGAYSHLVDDLIVRRKANTFPFDVVGCRGSFLELVLALEPYPSTTHQRVCGFFLVLVDRHADALEHLQIAVHRAHGVAVLLDHVWHDSLLPVLQKLHRL